MEQLFDTSQTRAIGDTLLLLMDLMTKAQWRGRTLADVLSAIDEELDAKVIIISKKDKPQIPNCPSFAKDSSLQEEARKLDSDGMRLLMTDTLE